MFVLHLQLGVLLVVNVLFKRRLHVKERREEIYRGHLDECQQHFSSAFSKRWRKFGKGTHNAKQPIADFCGVGAHTVTRWLNGTLPVGTARIRFMCYLDMMGYAVIELERIPQGRKNFLELIGYGLLTIEDATTFLEYSESSTLYQVLFGANNPNKEKEQKMWEIWKSKREELEKKKQEMFQMCRKIPKQKIRSGVVKKDTPSSIIVKPVVLVMMESLLVLLKHDPLGELKPQGLDVLRDSSDTVLDLNARLSALSSNLFARKSEVEKGLDVLRDSSDTVLDLNARLSALSSNLFARKSEVESG